MSAITAEQLEAFASNAINIIEILCKELPMPMDIDNILQQKDELILYYKTLLQSGTSEVLYQKQYVDKTRKFIVNIHAKLDILIGYMRNNDILINKCRYIIPMIDNYVKNTNELISAVKQIEEEYLYEKVKCMRTEIESQPQYTMQQVIDAFAIVPDFPKPGVTFRDITPLLLQPTLFNYAIDKAAKQLRERAIDFDYIAGIESRGFLFTALAAQMNKGFIMIRKSGKLPNGFSLGDAYGTEYSRGDVLCMSHAVPKGSRLLIVDDVLVTGGTVVAADSLATAYGCTVAGYFVFVELVNKKVALNPNFDHAKLTALITL